MARTTTQCGGPTVVLPGRLIGDGHCPIGLHRRLGDEGHRNREEAEVHDPNLLRDIEDAHGWQLLQVVRRTGTCDADAADANCSTVRS